MLSKFLLASALVFVLLLAALCAITMPTMVAAMPPGMGPPGMGGAEDNFVCAAHNGSHVFYAGGGDPAKAIIFRVLDNARTGAVNFGMMENGLTACGHSNQTALFATGASPTKIHKVDMRKKRRVGLALKLDEGEDTAHGIAMDEQHAFITLEKTPGKIVKLDWKTMKKVKVGELEKGMDNPYAIIIVGDFLWTGLQSSPGQVVKLTKDLEIDNHVTFREGMDYVQVLIADLQQQYVYAGLYTTPAYIVKIRADDCDWSSALSLAPDEGNAASAVIDAKFLYVGLDNDGDAGKIIQVRIEGDGINRVGNLTLHHGEKKLYAAASPIPGIGMFGAHTSPGMSIKMNLDHSGLPEGATPPPAHQEPPEHLKPKQEDPMDYPLAKPWVPKTEEEKRNEDRKQRSMAAGAIGDLETQRKISEEIEAEEAEKKKIRDAEREKKRDEEIRALEGDPTEEEEEEGESEGGSEEES